MKNKKPNNKDERISFDEMIDLKNVTYEDVTVYIFAKNRNPKQVPDQLWEELLEAHVTFGKYN
jgi:hypothetical protein